MPDDLTLTYRWQETDFEAVNRASAALVRAVLSDGKPPRAAWLMNALFWYGPAVLGTFIVILYEDFFPHSDFSWGSKTPKPLEVTQTSDYLIIFCAVLISTGVCVGLWRRIQEYSPRSSRRIFKEDCDIEFSVTFGARCVRVSSIKSDTHHKQVDWIQTEVGDEYLTILYRRGALVIPLRDQMLDGALLSDRIRAALDL